MRRLGIVTEHQAVERARGQALAMLAETLARSPTSLHGRFGDGMRPGPPCGCAWQKGVGDAPMGVRRRQSPCGSPGKRSTLDRPAGAARCGRARGRGRWTGRPRFPLHGESELSPWSVECGCRHGDGGDDCGDDGEDGGGTQGPLEHGEAPVSESDGMRLDRRHPSGVRASSAGCSRLRRTAEAATCARQPPAESPGSAPHDYGGAMSGAYGLEAAAKAAVVSPPSVTKKVVRAVAAGRARRTWRGRGSGRRR